MPGTPFVYTISTTLPNFLASSSFSGVLAVPITMPAPINLASCVAQQLDSSKSVSSRQAAGTLP